MSSPNPDNKLAAVVSQLSEGINLALADPSVVVIMVLAKPVGDNEQALSIMSMNTGSPMRIATVLGEALESMIEAVLPATESPIAHPAPEALQ